MITVKPLQMNNLSPITARLEPLIARFEPISLAEMTGVALLDRMETKYLLGVSQLCDVLGTLAGSYRVLEVNAVRLNHYQTLYFDTRDFALYRQRHNGFASRYKVRARKYVESELAFFEVKHKTNRARTLKSRLSIPDIVADTDDFDEFISTHTPFHAAMLEPKVWNEYVRVTLVSKTKQERLTLDLDISFHWDGDCEICHKRSVIRDRWIERSLVIRRAGACCWHRYPR